MIRVIEAHKIEKNEMNQMCLTERKFKCVIVCEGKILAMK